MVDVSDKAETTRTATASAVVTMSAATWTVIRDRQISKGDVLEVARLAGIMAAKQTPNLIPLCHPLPINGVTIDYVEPTTAGASAEPTAALTIMATVKVTGKTGVEMEALTAASVAALTVYDMCKAIDRAMVIGPIQLEAKAGGRSGEYRRDS
jgi:cyclic pyranopterin monophosphate synthase